MEEDEQDPSEEYLKAYNDGYQMARYEPKLLDEILRSNDSPYVTTMGLGKEQFEHEKLLLEMQKIRMRQKRQIKRKH